jgi:HSP20 family protein
MTLIRWNPFQMTRMHDRWNRLFDEVVGTGFGDDETQRVWRPRVDVKENEQEVRVLADLPGIRREDVSITLENGVLTINGERKVEEEKKDTNLHFSERVYGHFSRSFTIGETILQDKIEASFKDGVLTVVLPKAEQAKPRKIEISAA